MALTMTRTRTQTALNKLAGSLAEVNGELAFLDSLQRLRKDRQAAAAVRREELLRLREALCTVIRRYDPELNPEDIGATYAWMRAYGRKATAGTVGRYFGSMTPSVLQAASAEKRNPKGSTDGVYLCLTDRVRPMS
ncbi:hypothetical protein [Ramlibacter alkalitolerans]|uniref:Uncharacterized protein n=1 Tax=Ramlibacter alkalitolerans TaxID=2039631 RepID=A0ABS1JZY6_9BURK|nr:hypothetical protein [Ramlibacter alkalitolerans]MBL0428730.1 hypothetical protein [Ramlibacter alkalitolerans]